MGSVVTVGVYFAKIVAIILSFLRPCGLQVCDFTSVMYVPSFPLLLLTNTTEKVLKAWLQKLARRILYREHAWVKLQYFIIIVPQELLLK